MAPDTLFIQSSSARDADGFECATVSLRPLSLPSHSLSPLRSGACLLPQWLRTTGAARFPTARGCALPGRREVRYAHLFGDPNTEFNVAAATEVPSNPAEQDGRHIAELEGLVLKLQGSLEDMKVRLALLEGGVED